MPQFLTVNNFNTTLVQPASATTDTLSLATTAGLPNLATGQAIALTLQSQTDPSVREICYITAVSNSGVTVDRAQEGTSALSWNVRDIAYCALTAGSVTFPSNPSGYEWEGPQTLNNTVLQSGAAGAGNETPLLNTADAFSDFIASGMQWAIPTSASLTTSMSSGVAYLNGVRTLVPAVSGYNFPASNDTYVSSNNSGVIDYQSVANGATAPTPNSGYVQTAKVVTSPIQSPIPTLTASTSGSLASGTYGIALVAYDATGYGAVGASGSVTVSASGSIEISWVNPLNETSMDIYATTAGGTTLGLVASGVTGTSYTYTGSVAPGAAAPTTATSNAVQEAITIASTVPGFFKAPTVPTAISGANDNQVASTEFVQGVVSRGGNIQKLAIYYGYPISYNGIYTVSGVVSALNHFDIWVCGAGYEDPAQSVYSSTVQIIQGLRALGTKVFGYVTIGGPPLNTIDAIEASIANWNTIGVDGIFLDSAGFDFSGVTRSLQIAAKNSAASYGLPVAWNAYYFEHVAANTLTQVTWPSTSTVYTLFQTGNPNNEALPVDNGDVYIFEDFMIGSSGVDPSDPSNPSNSSMGDLQSHQKALQVVYGQPQVIFGQSATPPSPPLSQFEVWGIATCPQLNNSGLNINFSLLGNLNSLQQLTEYVWGCAYLYNDQETPATAPYMTALAISADGYGSYGYYLDTPRIYLPIGMGQPVGSTTTIPDYNTHQFIRPVGRNSYMRVTTNIGNAPVPPTLTYQTTGTLPAGTYEYVITRSSRLGQTLPSTTVSITTTAVGGVVVDWSNSVTGWERSFSVYGRMSGSLGLLNNTLIVTGTSFTDTGSLPPEEPVPTVNSAYEFTTNPPGLEFTDTDTISIGQTNGIYQSSQLSVSSTTASGSITATAYQLVGGYLADGATQTADFTVTTDTAANILAQMPNAAVGTSFKFRFINNDQSTTGYAGTLAGGTGVTVGSVLPNPAVPKGAYMDYLFTFTAVGSSPALTVEAVGGNSAALL